MNPSEKTCLTCHNWDNPCPHFMGDQSDFPILIGLCKVRDKDTDEFYTCESWQIKED